ncbi:MAG: hypothetical protein HOO06_06360 [Bdellovibrionaceae bacterium]|jgi:hypothetical protein|nr:hypothetical protein [Pseudobdellovibrionaceae bacterium]
MKKFVATLPIILLAVFTLILNACSISSSPPASVITQVNPDNEKKIQEVQKSLQAYSIVYEKGYKSFSRGDKILTNPCDQKLRKTLKNSTLIIRKIKSTLDPEKKLYRDAALVFYRKTNNMKKSLEEIIEPLNQFCSNEQASVQACFKKRNNKSSMFSIVLWVNRRVAGYGQLHSLLLPSASDSIAITTSTSDEDEKLDFRSIDTDTGTQAHGTSFSNLVKISKESELLEISNCLQKTNSKSSILKNIKLTVKNSLTRATKHCDELLDIRKLGQFCIPYPQAKNRKFSILKQPVFHEYYEGLSKVDLILDEIISQLSESESAYDRFISQSKPLDPSDPLNFLDHNEGESETERVARLRSIHGDVVQKSLEKIKIQIKQIEYIFVDYHSLFKNTFFPTDFKTSLIPNIGSIYRDETSQRLMSLSNGKTDSSVPPDQEDKRRLTFSLLFQLHNKLDRLQNVSYLTKIDNYIDTFNLDQLSLNKSTEILETTLLALKAGERGKEILSTSDDYDEILDKLLIRP